MRTTTLKVMRGYSREARRRLLTQADAVGLASPRAVRPRGPVPPYAVIGIYRARNERTVQRLMRSPLRDEAEMALWALDRVAPRLDDLTVGCGPGQRFDLLNRILELRPPSPDRYLVITDDDIVVPSGLGQFVATVAEAGFDLAMAAHLPYSHFSHDLTRRRRLSAARLTTYVEIGPLLCLSPEWRSRITPFPAETGLGWGAEFAWSQLRDEGCRLGIVDATPVLHLSPPGRAYDTKAEMERLVQSLRVAGVPERGSTRDQVNSLQHTLSVWPRYRSRPPW
jgi:hypothetical protein